MKTGQLFLNRRLSVRDVGDTDIPCQRKPDTNVGALLDNRSMESLDFTSPASVQGWLPIDDRVMGGVSVSRLVLDPAGFAVFEGAVSPDRGGGFASVRRSALHLGSESTQAYRLTVFGDGHRYKLNLRTDADFDGVHHQAAFVPIAHQWSTLVIRLDEFQPMHRGRRVHGVEPLRPERVAQVGLMVGDRQWGSFRLAIRSIDAMAG